MEKKCKYCNSNFIDITKSHNKIFCQSKCKHSQYRKENPEKHRLKNKKYRDSNREKYNSIQKEWCKNNRDKRRDIENKYYHEVQKENLHHKLTRNIRSRIKKYLSRNSNSNSTLKIVGCTPEHLKQHLEKQFDKDMSWDNYGLYGWHIDHIIPLASAKTEQELYSLCHYTNLQPLWAEDNLSKGSKLN